MRKFKKGSNFGALGSEVLAARILAALGSASLSYLQALDARKGRRGCPPVQISKALLLQSTEVSKWLDSLTPEQLGTLNFYIKERATTRNLLQCCLTIYESTFFAHGKYADVTLGKPS